MARRSSPLTDRGAAMLAWARSRAGSGFSSLSHPPEWLDNYGVVPGLDLMVANGLVRRGLLVERASRIYILTPAGEAEADRVIKSRKTIVPVQAAEQKAIRERRFAEEDEGWV